MKNLVVLKKFQIMVVLVVAGLIIGSCNNPKKTMQLAKVYVANEDGGSISVINLQDSTKNTEISISDSSGMMFMAHNVQVAPDGKSVWVTAIPMDSTATNQLIVIDPNTNSIKKRIELGKDLHLAHVVLDSKSEYAYASANETNQIFQVDAKTYKMTQTFELGKGYLPHGFRHQNGKLYVANMDAKSMSIITIADGTITDIPLGGVAVQVATTQDEKFIFSSLYDTKEVVKYDIKNGQLTRIKLPNDAQGPIQLYATPDSKFLYVADQGETMGRPVSNKVFVIDITSNKVIKTITVGNKAHGVVVSKDGKTVYVTNGGDNTISVIEVATQKVINTIAVGKKPNGISYWFETGGME
ncbi:YncE family protein [Flavobacterium sp. LB2P6]|uniref:YncE family protein n=1 Tax=Flavobacterium sp. LB2P6 TaxID=3401714 RepID=UPI003AAF48FB